MKSDFVNVKLSEAGEKYAGEGKVVRVATGRCHFEFKVGEAQRVTLAYEWKVVLAPMKAGTENMFEVVEEQPQDKTTEA